MLTILFPVSFYRIVNLLLSFQMCNLYFIILGSAFSLLIEFGPLISQRILVLLQFFSVQYLVHLEFLYHHVKSVKRIDSQLKMEKQIFSTHSPFLYEFLLMINLSKQTISLLHDNEILLHFNESIFDPIDSTKFFRGMKTRTHNVVSN